MNDKVGIFTKEERNKRIMDLHNSGRSTQEIADAVSMSKGGVHKVVTAELKKGTAPSKEKPIEVKLTGTEERFDNFSGWNRIDVNRYEHKDTKEIVDVAYVKATDIAECGYFVRVPMAQQGQICEIPSNSSDSEKKSDPADDVIIKEAEQNIKNGKGVKL